MSSEEIATPSQEQTKRCSKCDKVKVLSEFHASGKAKDGKKTRCKNCVSKDARRTTDKLRNEGEYKTWKRRKHLRDCYDLTIEQYHAMEKSQGGVCAICGNPETTCNRYGANPLSVDHDHNTGKVRGLLCIGCNLKLKRLEDGNWTLAAIAYLKNHSLQEPAILYLQK